jgi:hypothetical protein
LIGIICMSGTLKSLISCLIIESLVFGKCHGSRSSSGSFFLLLLFTVLVVLLCEPRPQNLSPLLLVAIIIWFRVVSCRVHSSCACALFEYLVKNVLRIYYILYHIYIRAVRIDNVVVVVVFATALGFTTQAPSPSSRVVSNRLFSSSSVSACVLSFVVDSDSNQKRADPFSDPPTHNAPRDSNTSAHSGQAVSDRMTARG